MNKFWRFKTTFKYLDWNSSYGPSIKCLNPCAVFRYKGPWGKNVKVALSQFWINESKILYLVENLTKNFWIPRWETNFFQITSKIIIKIGKVEFKWILLTHGPSYSNETCIVYKRSSTLFIQWKTCGYLNFSGYTTSRYAQRGPRKNYF